MGPSDVRNLVLNENLQNERSHFVLKSTAQCLNSRAVDDVLKLAADASVGAVNLIAHPVIASTRDDQKEGCIKEIRIIDAERRECRVMFFCHCFM